MKIFTHYAEICPRCGAIGSMRKNIPHPTKRGMWLFTGKSLTAGGEHRTYVACEKCAAQGIITRALRVTRMPPS